MMFWSRSSSSSYDDGSSNRPSHSRNHSVSNNTDNGSSYGNGKRMAGVPPAPFQRRAEALALANGSSHRASTADSASSPSSHALSEQRRQQLLQAARASRASWVDSAGPEHAQGGSWRPRAAPQVPMHCQEAVARMTDDLNAFFTGLDKLKKRIRPGIEIDDVDASTSRSTSVRSRNENNNGGEADATGDLVTIAQELRNKQSELDAWRRIHLPGAEEAAASSSQGHPRGWAPRDRERRFLLAYGDLLAVLKHPYTAETVYQIQLFVQTVEHWDLAAMLQHRGQREHERPGPQVQAFVTRLAQQMQHHARVRALFQGDVPAGVSCVSLAVLTLEHDEEQLLAEVLEAFILEKIYARVLTPSRRALDEDEAFHERLRSLAFLEFRHLDLPEPRSDATRKQWQALADELAVLPRYPSPRRKMDCVLRVCQDLTTLLTRRPGQQQRLDGDPDEDGDGGAEPTRFPSADEFLPALIYLVLRANPRALKRSVQFILEYRRPSRLVSEPGYFFTHLVSSVAFLEQVEGDLLSITSDEFEEGLRRCRQAVADARAQAATMEVAEEVGVEKKKEKQASDAPGEADPIKESVATDELYLPTVLEVRARRLAAERTAQ